MKISEVIRLGKADNTKALAFIEEFSEIAQPHPMNNRAFILHNVKLEISAFGGKIHIGDVLSHERGKGNMGKAFGILKDLANKHDVVMELDTYGYDDVSTETLNKIYKKLGFEVYREHGDGEGATMRYYPN